MPQLTVSQGTNTVPMVLYCHHTVPVIANSQAGGVDLHSIHMNSLRWHAHIDEHPPFNLMPCNCMHAGSINTLNMLAGMAAVNKASCNRISTLGQDVLIVLDHAGTVA